MSGFYYHNAPNCQQYFYGYQESEVASQTAESGGYSTRAASLEEMSQGETQRQDPVTYNASIKVLNCANKKEFNVYRLRDITNNHFATPISLREEIFR